MKRARQSVFMVLILIILIASANEALASTSTWNGAVGGVNVRAEKEVYLDDYGWGSDLISAADQNINIIGYTYWTLGEYCPATLSWAYWTQYPGTYNTNNRFYWTSATIYYVGCNGQSQYKSLGNHDFANGSDHIYPYVTTHETR